MGRDDLKGCFFLRETQCFLFSLVLVLIDFSLFFFFLLFIDS